jgi:hypothetical protein
MLGVMLGVALTEGVTLGVTLGVTEFVGGGVIGIDGGGLAPNDKEGVGDTVIVGVTEIVGGGLAPNDIEGVILGVDVTEGLINIVGDGGGLTTPPLIR